MERKRFAYYTCNQPQGSKSPTPYLPENHLEPSVKLVKLFFNSPYPPFGGYIIKGNGVIVA